MPPQVGVSVETERPTKERIASTMTAMPISTVSSVTMSGRTLGRISAKSVRAAAEPDDAGGGDIVELALELGLGADDAGEAGPVDDDDGEHDGAEAGADGGGKHNGQKHRRERHPDVDEARHDGVDEPAEIAGDEAEERADEAGEDRGNDGDEGGDTGAVDETGEDIAAEAVGAEKVQGIAARLPGRRELGVEEILGERVVRREEGRCERGEEERRDDDPAGDRPRVDREPPPPGPFGRARGVNHAAASGRARR